MVTYLLIVLLNSEKISRNIVTVKIGNLSHHLASKNLYKNMKKQITNKDMIE